MKIKIMAHLYEIPYTSGPNLSFDINERVTFSSVCETLKKVIDGDCRSITLSINDKLYVLYDRYERDNPFDKLDDESRRERLSTGNNLRVILDYYEGKYDRVILNIFMITPDSWMINFVIDAEGGCKVRSYELGRVG